LKVRIGTRGSDLALWQANHVAGVLNAADVETELVVLKTRGDVIDDIPLTAIEGKAFFTTEIEAALLEERVDLAVHSHKDLPVEVTEGLAIVGVPPRADPRERLLVRPDKHDATELFLPIAHGATVGTSSPRRAEQLRALRPDLAIADLRGNVPTRVRKLREGQYDAIVLAAAGLDRLELDTSDLAVELLATDQLVPAPAQGALAIQVRAGDENVTALCRELLHDEATERAIHAERQLLLAAGGGCSLPLGACVERDGERWRARTFSGVSRARWAEAVADEPDAAARTAFEKMDANEPTGDGPLASLSVALTGSSDGGTTLGARLVTLGARVVHERVVSFEDLAQPDLLDRVAALAPGDVLAVTSRQTAPRLVGASVADGVTVAAVGPSTARALEDAGLPVHVVGDAGARELAQRLDLAPEGRVFFPCAEGALDTLEHTLGERGAQVERLPVYRTIPAPDVRLDADVDVRVYMSPSSVRAALAFERAHPERRTLRVALGPSTEAELAAHELPCVASADPIETLARLATARHEPENER
jgi:hydroxymethylbilane synthase